MVTTLDHLKHKDDLGPIQFKVGIIKEEVIVDFGRPVTWISLTPKMADDIAEILREKSELIKEMKKNAKKKN